MDRFLVLRGLLGGLLLCIVCVGTAQTSSTALSLFNGKDLSGWKPYLDPSKGAKPGDVWSVKDGTIVCTGVPTGYLRTEKEYSDYVLRLEWRWTPGEQKGRNSGVFVHVSGPDKVWPKGAEAQLAAGSAGDFWLMDGYKLVSDPARKDPKNDRHVFRSANDVEKPFGEWNQYEITCKGRDVDLKINGTLVNRGSDAETTGGAIILQSEGAEIHFRNITLTPL